MSGTYSFEYLQLITNGNAALDIELLEIFLTTSRAYINDLRDSLNDTESDAWRHNAHALKGGASNIGGDYLAALCKLAESVKDDSGNYRTDLLKKIEEEFASLEKAIHLFIDQKKREANE